MQVKIILPLFLIFCFITTIAGAWSGYLAHHPFNMGDWLINYQSGFVRRGFLGSLILYISKNDNINPGINTAIIQVFFYAVFFWYSYKLLKKQAYIRPYLFLIFSPFIFTFQINDLGGGFRKEIIYFALFAFLVYQSKAKDNKFFEKIFFITIILYPFFILSHEIFIIFLPYILVIYFQKYKLSKTNIVSLIFLLIPSIIAFFIVVYNTFDNSINTNNIFLELANQNYSIEKGAINWLQTSSSFNLNFVLENIYSKKYFFIYPLALILGILSFIPISKKYDYLFENKPLFTLILISIFGSIPLFIIAADWGRFIYIHLVSWFLLSFLSDKEILNNNYYFDKFSLFILVLLYFSLWHIPHCCSNTIFVNKNNNIIRNWVFPYFYIYHNALSPNPSPASGRGA